MDLTADYAAQLAHKQRHFADLFASVSLPTLEVFASAPQHYRMRAEFRIWHEGDDCCYAMFQQGQKPSTASLVRIREFPAAHGHIGRLMEPLMTAMQANPLLRDRWYQAEFLTTLYGQTLVTLVYHKKLDDAWAAAARALAANLGVAIVGRSRGQKWVLTQDYVEEVLTVHNRRYHYRQMEAAFSQPNAQMCQHMLAWACDVAAPLGGDLLELYCGNGNFTLPLAQHFRKVLATELSKTAVAAARWNIAANGVDNITLARLSAAEFAAAYRGDRIFQRLAEAGVALADYRFSTVLVDPPRAGVDADSLALLQQFDNIIYISCNPETLRQNVGVLLQTHSVGRAAVFDQFPWTPHIEAGLWLRRR